MSGAAEPAVVNPDGTHASNEALDQGQQARSASQKDYKGFVAGVGSGIAKLSGMNENRSPPPKQLQPPGLLITGFDTLQLAIRMILPVFIEYKRCMIS